MRSGVSRAALPGRDREILLKTDKHYCSCFLLYCFLLWQEQNRMNLRCRLCLLFIQSIPTEWQLQRKHHLSTTHILKKILEKSLCLMRIRYSHQHISGQLLSCVQLFVTPWTIVRQASLSIANSSSLLKLICIKLVMPSILCHPLLFHLQSFPASESFQMSQFFTSVGQLEFQLKHQFFQ